MVATTWLTDKSALVRLAASPEAPEWASRASRQWCHSGHGLTTPPGSAGMGFEDIALLGAHIHAHQTGSRILDPFG